MKKIILSFGFLLLFSSCQNGRYQMSISSNHAPHILDTKTGDFYWHVGGDEWVKVTGPINGELVEY